MNSIHVSSDFPYWIISFDQLSSGSRNLRLCGGWGTPFHEIISSRLNLSKFNLVDTIKKVAEKDTPFLGICLGLQLLFEKSDETPGAEGLGILKGEILRIPPKEGLKIPHMGWNSLNIKPQARLFDGIANNSYVYFVHSYYLKAADENIVAASTEYSTHIHASVESGNIFACQFHPEKSSDVGLRILKNFASL